MRRIKKSEDEPPHSISEHNENVTRNRHKKIKCPLCENGSKVVHETELEEKK
jgi:hypothetical protein